MLERGFSVDNVRNILENANIRQPGTGVDTTGYRHGEFLVVLGNANGNLVSVVDDRQEE